MKGYLLDDIAKSLITNLDTIDNTKKLKNISLVYAFNGTGKTRTSRTIEILTENKSLCYNALIEDLFHWDNRECILYVDTDSWLIKIILEQGLENAVTDNFRDLVLSKIEPEFDLDNGKITFNIATGDDEAVRNIKISKGEESLFIWTIYYTVLEMVVAVLNEKEENRYTSEFDNVEYIIIDDPISSIDDTKIIAIAIKIIDLVRIYNGVGSHKLKFLITTHHSLFYNILFNNYNKQKHFILTKKDNLYELHEQNNDSPFGYHLLIKKEIEEAIERDNIKKYHFNYFRTLLEKTANFLGYSNWADCISSENRTHFLKIINHYSHGKISDIEYKEISHEDKALFKEVYSNFIRSFNWKEN